MAHSILSKTNTFNAPSPFVPVLPRGVLLITTCNLFPHGKRHRGRQTSHTACLRLDPSASYSVQKGEREGRKGWTEGRACQCQTLTPSHTFALARNRPPLFMHSTSTRPNKRPTVKDRPHSLFFPKKGAEGHPCLIRDTQTVTRRPRGFAKPGRRRILP